MASDTEANNYKKHLIIQIRTCYDRIPREQWPIGPKNILNQTTENLEHILKDAKRLHGMMLIQEYERQMEINFAIMRARLKEQKRLDIEQTD